MPSDNITVVARIADNFLDNPPMPVVLFNILFQIGFVFIIAQPAPWSLRPYYYNMRLTHLLFTGFYGFINLSVLTQPLRPAESCTATQPFGPGVTVSSVFSFSIHVRWLRSSDSR